MKTFTTGDYVVNSSTNHLGRVVGYGHWMKDGAYLPTLKVLIDESNNSKKQGFIEEDLYSSWVLWQGTMHEFA